MLFKLASSSLIFMHFLVIACFYYFHSVIIFNQLSGARLQAEYLSGKTKYLLVHFSIQFTLMSRPLLTLPAGPPTLPALWERQSDGHQVLGRIRHRGKEFHSHQASWFDKSPFQEEKKTTCWLIGRETCRSRPSVGSTSSQNIFFKDLESYCFYCQVAWMHKSNNGLINYFFSDL